MKRLANIVINSDEFNTADKIDLLTTCADYRAQWTKEKARHYLSVMEAEKPYTCRDILNALGCSKYASYQKISNNFRSLIKIGAIRKEKIETGRTFEVDNPKYTRIYNDIEWYKTYLNKGIFDSQRSLAEYSMATLQKQLLETPKTFTVKETITYYYRPF